MKTIYCLGKSPQFKFPCIKYNYLLKEKDNQINNLMTLPKNEIEFNDYEMNEIENMDEEEKKEIVDQMLDQMYPNRGIKRCMQIKPKNKIQLRNLLKGFKQSLGVKKNKIKIEFENNKQNSVNKNENERYKSTNTNNSKINNYTNESQSINNNTKTLNNSNRKYNKSRYLSEPSRNKFGNLSHKLFNYNYPISHEENSEHFSQFLNEKYLNTKENIISNSIDAYKSKNNTNLKMAYKTLNSFSNSNKKRSIGVQFSKMNNNNNNKIDKNLFQKRYLANIFGDTLEKLKRKKGETQDNELNIIYSETRDQFYRKYDKYRKNENLKGLGLTNINYPPKLKFKELEKKITEIKKKVINVKSIVDNTFPKVLAYLTWTKKEYENSLKKKGFDTPYKERLNMLEKHQKYINLYLSSPIEIVSRNKKNL